MFVNGDTKKKTYELEITALCPNTSLYFSLWMVNIVRAPLNLVKPDLEFVLFDKSTGDTISIYRTGTTIMEETSFIWRQYGFQFNTPVNVADIVFRVYSYGNGGGGNDYAIDDIEVRLCAPEVVTNIAGNDTIVCFGNNLNIIGTYIEDCTFGNDLAYQWEFRHVDSVNWKSLTPKNVTIDCAAANPADRTITETVSITSASKADEGYYRMLVSSPTNIGSVNCRAASDSVYVHIVDKYVAPDIRIQICPSPPKRTVQLSKYLDSTDYDRIEWEKVSSYPVIANAETGLIQDANFHKRGTYTFKYTLRSPEYSGCGESSARVYMRVLNDRVFGKTIDTITVCSALATSRSVNLNRIFGLELGGVWSYSDNPDNVVIDNITEFTAASKYAGAVMFNAQNAYSKAGDIYNKSYRGISGKAFEFVYTASSSCVNVTKRVVLVVTP
jgi:hypothetical protein